MNIKRITSALLSLCLLNADFSLNIPVTQTVQAEQESNTDFSGEPAYEPGQTYSQKPDTDNIYKQSNEYPQSFDLRERGLVSSVKNQGDYGTCWVFSAIAAIESSLMKTDPLIDLSENHLAVFSFYGDDSLELQNGYSYFTVGGHPNYAVSTLSQWKGPVDERISPYSPDSDEVDPELEYLSQYHLKNADLLNEYSLSRIYPNDIKTMSVNQIKQSIINEKAITADFAYDTSGKSYNQNTYSQYATRRSTPNHSVLIVGWDDNYSSENFLSSPPANGAWLAKNSWGTDWGDNGYFWISYYDKSISSTTSYEFEAADNYSGCYQYDTLAYTASICADNTDRNTSYMSNIFTADKSEYITAAGLYTTDNNAEYEISVYSSLSDPTNPASGRQSTITKGTSQYAGYHVIDLDNPVYVTKGQKFSIVAKLTNPEKPYPIPVESAVILCENGMSAGVGGISEAKINKSSDYGESFISYNGTKWTDTKGIKFETAYDSLVIRNKNIAYYPGNVCLKAFSNDEGYIHFSKDSGKIAYGSSVTLNSSFPGKIRYTTDGTVPDKTSKVYSGPITITSDTTLKAVVESESGANKVYTKNYSQSESVLSSLTINSLPLDVISDGKINTSLSYTIDGTKDKVILSPIGSGKITINGTQIISGQKTDEIALSPGYNTITIKSEEEGKKTTEYTLSVFKNYAAVDYTDEVIVFDEDVADVKADDGHAFVSGESISKYLGQTLTVTADGKKSEIKTTPRLNLSSAIDPSIYYGIEVLSDIFSLSYQMRFSYSPDMSDSQPITSRIYAMLSENYFKIYPESDRELYFQIPANDDAPASSVMHISIPDRTEIPDNAVKLGTTEDNRIFFTIDNAYQKKAEYILEVKTSKQASFTSSLPISLSQRCKEDTTYIDNVLPGQTYMLYITMADNSESFKSYVKPFEITIPGDTPAYSFNYKNETIIFDENKYTVSDYEGRTIECYDIISDYIGKSLKITDKSGASTEIIIPERPVLDDITLDYKNERLTNVFSKNTRYTKTLASTNYPIYDNYISSICDKNGIVWMDKVYESSIDAGDILHFYIEATETSFASEQKGFVVPARPRISQFNLDILKFTDTEIFLNADSNLEYGIKTDFSDKFKWQDSSVFSDLNPSSMYIIGIRTRSSENTLCSRPVITLVTTLPEQIIYGDMDDNGSLSVTDLLILKRTILKSVNPDSQQKRSGDMNNDGVINTFDYMRLLRHLMGTQ